MRAAAAAACVALCARPAAARFDDAWFSQWTENDRYIASDLSVQRMPLRLESTESVVYGAAELDAVIAHLTASGEDWVPVSVGGKAAVSIWMNNFTDTDCAAPMCNGSCAYHETWFNFPVTPRDAPISLPHNSDMDYIVTDPRPLNLVYRVICGNAPGSRLAAMSAISGGREVWGFPKHNELATITLAYDGNYTQFDAVHRGKPVLEMRMKLPETVPGAVKLDLDARTGADSCTTPRWLVKQTRYGQAFKATEYVAPWDPATDSLTIHNDEYYGSILNSWAFEPKMKMHSTDFKIVAFKPAGWIGAEH